MLWAFQHSHPALTQSLRRHGEMKLKILVIFSVFIFLSENKKFFNDKFEGKVDKDNYKLI